MTPKYTLFVVALCVGMLINIKNQNNEELPEIYYRILNNSMAIEGEGHEYTRDEIMADSDMPLIFRTILCGDFENIPWGIWRWMKKRISIIKNIIIREHGSFY
ncbi:MAG: hypothetical protein K2H40_07175 [Lachnospiraceae bacterium]|nr:hypothetical protein [Lachnospiraceae bacterium]